MIVRKDQVINLCEMKYSQTEYTITAKDRDSILHKIHDLTVSTNMRYAIHPTIVTCIGLVSNSNSDFVQAIVTADDFLENDRVGRYCQEITAPPGKLTKQQFPLNARTEPAIPSFVA